MPVVTLQFTSSCVLCSKVNGNLTVKSIVLIYLVILPLTKHVDRIVQVTRKCLDNPTLSSTVSAALLSLLLSRFPSLYSTRLQRDRLKLHFSSFYFCCILFHLSDLLLSFTFEKWISHCGNFVAFVYTRFPRVDGGKPTASSFPSFSFHLCWPYIADRPSAALSRWTFGLHCSGSITPIFLSSTWWYLTRGTWRPSFLMATFPPPINLRFADVELNENCLCLS